MALNREKTLAFTGFGNAETAGDLFDAQNIDHLLAQTTSSTNKLQADARTVPVRAAHEILLGEA